MPPPPPPPVGLRPPIHVKHQLQAVDHGVFRSGRRPQLYSRQSSSQTFAPQRFEPGTAGAGGISSHLSTGRCLDGEAGQEEGSGRGRTSFSCWIDSFSWCMASACVLAQEFMSYSQCRICRCHLACSACRAACSAWRADRRCSHSLLKGQWGACAEGAVRACLPASAPPSLYPKATTR